MPADWAWGGGLLDVLLPSWHYGVPVLAYRAPRFDPEYTFRLIAYGPDEAQEQIGSWQASPGAEFTMEAVTHFGRGSLSRLELVQYDGKALLAYSPAAVVQARIDAGLPRLTPRTITTPGALQRDLRQTRTRGFAQDREESHVGVSCVAAPVFGSDTKVRAALSITGRTTSIDPARLGPAVLTAAHTLGRALRDSHL